MSKQDDVLKIAFDKGYRIDDEGILRKDSNIIIGSIPRTGYKKFSIKNINKETHPVFFHRLVGYQKYGDEIFNKNMVIRHLNGNILDNSWDNILIGTQSDNMMDIPKEIRMRSSIDASRKMQEKNRSHEERCKIYEDLKNGISYSEIMKKYGVTSKGTLSFMKNKSIEYKEYIGK